MELSLPISLIFWCSSSSLWLGSEISNLNIFFLNGYDLSLTCCSLYELVFDFEVASFEFLIFFCLPEFSTPFAEPKYCWQLFFG
jgi:hypothetical protein